MFCCIESNLSSSKSSSTSRKFASEEFPAPIYELPRERLDGLLLVLKLRPPKAPFCAGFVAIVLRAEALLAPWLLTF